MYVSSSKQNITSQAHFINNLWASSYSCCSVINLQSATSHSLNVKVGCQWLCCEDTRDHHLLLHPVMLMSTTISHDLELKKQPRHYKLIATSSSFFVKKLSCVSWYEIFNKLRFIKKENRQWFCNQRRVREDVAVGWPDRPVCVEMEMFGDIPTSMVYLDMDLNQQDVPFQMETIS